MAHKLGNLVDSYPKASGQQTNLPIKWHSNTALKKAKVYLKDFKDEFVAVEHLLLRLAVGSDKVGMLMKEENFQEQELIKATQELRGIHRVTDQRYKPNRNREVLFT